MLRVKIVSQPRTARSSLVQDLAHSLAKSPLDSSRHCCYVTPEWEGVPPGPSCAIDNSWCVAHMELKQAAEAIRNGQCEAALVVAAGMARYPQASALLRQMGLISDDGLTRPYHPDGNN